MVIEEPWAFHPPSKIARSSSSEMNDTSHLVVDMQRTTPTTHTTPFYSLPETHLSPGIGNFASLASQTQREERDDSSVAAHSRFGRFPSVSLFKEYPNAAMAILEKTELSIHFLSTRARAKDEKKEQKSGEPNRCRDLTQGTIHDDPTATSTMNEILWDVLEMEVPASKLLLSQWFVP